jgi:predicted RNase H-like HicB family nuclease
MSRFTVVIHPQLDGGFWGEIPSLPGCCSRGDSVEELVHSLRDLARGVVEALREEGLRPQPEVQIAELLI